MAFADTATQSHVHYRGLREWLDKVQGMGELLCVNGADWNAEMGSITQMLTENIERHRAGDPVRRNSGLRRKASAPSTAISPR